MRASDKVHLNWLEDLGSSDFSNQSVLDLGCGSGYVCQHAASEGASAVVGVDILRPDIPSLGKTWNFRTLDLDSSDWSQDLTREGESFSRILAFDIIEHLSSPWHFIQNCRDLLKEGGELIITTPNTNSWERLHNPNGWSGVTDQQHKTLFTPYSLEFLLKTGGFLEVETSAPVNKLRFLGGMLPKIGGQILCRASVG